MWYLIFSCSRQLPSLQHSGINFVSGNKPTLSCITYTSVLCKTSVMSIYTAFKNWKYGVVGGGSPHHSIFLQSKFYVGKSDSNSHSILVLTSPTSYALVLSLCSEIAVMMMLCHQGVFFWLPSMYYLSPVAILILHYFSCSNKRTMYYAQPRYMVLFLPILFAQDRQIFFLEGIANSLRKICNTSKYFPLFIRTLYYDQRFHPFPPRTTIRPPWPGIFLPPTMSPSRHLLHLHHLYWPTRWQ